MKYLKVPSAKMKKCFFQRKGKVFFPNRQTFLKIIYAYSNTFGFIFLTIKFCCLRKKILPPAQENFAACERKFCRLREKAQFSILNSQFSIQTKPCSLSPPHFPHAVCFHVFRAFPCTRLVLIRYLVRRRFRCAGAGG